MAIRSIHDAQLSPVETSPITDADGMPVQSVVLGDIADSAEVNPSAESASIAALLRGILTQQVAILAILTDVYDASGHTIKTSSS